MENIFCTVCGVIIQQSNLNDLMSEVRWDKFARSLRTDIGWENPYMTGVGVVVGLDIVGPLWEDEHIREMDTTDGQGLDRTAVWNKSGLYWAIPGHEACWELLPRFFRKGEYPKRDILEHWFYMMCATALDVRGVPVPGFSYGGIAEFNQGASGFADEVRRDAALYFILEDPGRQLLPGIEQGSVPIPAAFARLLEPPDEPIPRFGPAAAHAGGASSTVPTDDDPFARLPREVVHGVAAHLEPRAVAALRLASRGAAAVTHATSLPMSFWAARFAPPEEELAYFPLGEAAAAADAGDPAPDWRAAFVHLAALTRRPGPADPVGPAPWTTTTTTAATEARDHGRHYHDDESAPPAPVLLLRAAWRATLLNRRRIWRAFGREFLPALRARLERDGGGHGLGRPRAFVGGGGGDGGPTTLLPPGCRRGARASGALRAGVLQASRRAQRCRVFDDRLLPLSRRALAGGDFLLNGHLPSLRVGVSYVWWGDRLFVSGFRVGWIAAAAAGGSSGEQHADDDHQAQSPIGLVGTGAEEDCLVLRPGDAVVRVDVAATAAGVVGLRFVVRNAAGELACWSTGVVEPCQPDTGIGVLQAHPMRDIFALAVGIDAFKVVSIQVIESEPHPDADPSQAAVLSQCQVPLWTPSVPVGHSEVIHGGPPAVWTPGDENNVATSSHPLLLYMPFGGPDGQRAGSLSRIVAYVGDQSESIVGLGFGYDDGGLDIYGQTTYRSRTGGVLIRALEKAEGIDGRGGERIVKACVAYDPFYECVQEVMLYTKNRILTFGIYSPGQCIWYNLEPPKGQTINAFTGEYATGRHYLFSFGIATVASDGSRGPLQAPGSGQRLHYRAPHFVPAQPAHHALPPPLPPPPPPQPDHARAATVLAAQLQSAGRPGCTAARASLRRVRRITVYACCDPAAAAPEGWLAKKTPRKAGEQHVHFHCVAGVRFDYWRAGSDDDDDDDYDDDGDDKRAAAPPPAAAFLGNCAGADDGPMAVGRLELERGEAIRELSHSTSAQIPVWHNRLKSSAGSVLAIAFETTRGRVLACEASKGQPQLDRPVLRRARQNRLQFLDELLWATTGMFDSVHALLRDRPSQPPRPALRTRGPVDNLPGELWVDQRFLFKEAGPSSSSRDDDHGALAAIKLTFHSPPTTGGAGVARHCGIRGLSFLYRGGLAVSLGDHDDGGHTATEEVAPAEDVLRLDVGVFSAVWAVGYVVFHMSSGRTITFVGPSVTHPSPSSSPPPSPSSPSSSSSTSASLPVTRELRLLLDRSAAAAAQQPAGPSSSPQQQRQQVVDVMAYETYRCGRAEGVTASLFRVGDRQRDGFDRVVLLGALVPDPHPEKGLPRDKLLRHDA